jgi:hypothetical protein
MKNKRNWAQYNQSLVNRGNITFWFSDDVLASWSHPNHDYRRGRPFVYSDTAIETLLVVREVFHLTYRSTEGFGRNIFSLLGVQDARIPDYTSLCKRSRTLDVPLKVFGKSGPLNILVDSTGLKVYGEGEWKVLQHGKDKRRTWINAENQQIVAIKTTPNSTNDAEVVPEFLKLIDDKINTFCGDGAYDQRKIYLATSEHDIRPVIPPRKNARLDHVGAWGSNGYYRNDAILTTRLAGLSAWKEQVGYHRRSLVETAMFRIKKIFGERLKNRTPENQKVETVIKANVLNVFTALGTMCFC